MTLLDLPQTLIYPRAKTISFHSHFPFLFSTLSATVDLPDLQHAIPCPESIRDAFTWALIVLPGPVDKKPVFVPPRFDIESDRPSPIPIFSETDRPPTVKGTGNLNLL